MCREGARAEAAKLIGLNHIPVIRLAHLSETELRAYMLADNKLAANAGWDREILAGELEELQIALPEIGLTLDITGFEPGEVDSIITDFADTSVNLVDDIPKVEDVAVAREGDAFVLGRHRLVVGDAATQASMPSSCRAKRRRWRSTICRTTSASTATLAAAGASNTGKLQGCVAVAELFGSSGDRLLLGGHIVQD